MATRLNRWFDMTNPGEDYKTYTRDTWEIPEAGTEIWCTGWKRGQTLKPYGDGAHVVVGLSVYHCDELMGIMTNREKDGDKWGIDGVKPSREQLINGRWKAVEIPTKRLSEKQIEAADAYLVKLENKMTELESSRHPSTEEMERLEARIDEVTTTVERYTCPGELVPDDIFAKFEEYSLCCEELRQDARMHREKDREEMER